MNSKLHPEGKAEIPLYDGFSYAFLPVKKGGHGSWEFYWKFPDHLVKEYHWKEIRNIEKMEVFLYLVIAN